MDEIVIVVRLKGQGISKEFHTMASALEFIEDTIISIDFEGETFFIAVQKQNNNGE